MSTLPQFELDWQHIILASIAIAGGFLCAFKPEIAHIIGPLVSAIVPLALTKNSPVVAVSQAVACNRALEEARPTVINISSIPSNSSCIDCLNCKKSRCSCVTITNEDDLKIS